MFKLTKLRSALFFSSLALITALSLQNIWAQEEKVPDVPVKVGMTSFSQNNLTYVAVHFQNHESWHTYWSNPGDAGLPINNTFRNKDGKEITVKELERPTPKRFVEEGNMWAYGHEGEYTFFYSLPADFNGDVIFESTWLACKHICIPGKILISFSWPDFKITNVNPENFHIKNINQDLIGDNFSKMMPTIDMPQDLELFLVKGDQENPLTLYYTLSSQTPLEASKLRNLLTPYPIVPFDFKHEFLYQDKKGQLYGKMPISWDGQYQEPPQPLPTDGFFEKSYNLKFIFNNPLTNQASVIQKEFKSFGLENANRLEEMLKLFTPIPPPTSQDSKSSNQTNSETTDLNKPGQEIFIYFLMAILGGLLLNVMPCVLPVISIKLFGLLKAKEKGDASVFKHNLFYSLGILLTFLVLGLIMAFLKSSGEQVGWGFQLQSPTFVLIMILIIFTFALNLFGLFEFGTPGGRILGDLHLKSGPISDMGSGVLAVILSTPCSAPILGTALTFALGSSTIMILGIFLFVGLGLALPFIVTAFFPKLINILPKPGRWMEHLKKFLGVALILTAIWLIDVYTALTSTGMPLFKLNILLIAIFFAFYFRRHISTSAKLGAFFFLIPILLFIQILLNADKYIQQANSHVPVLLQEKLASGLEWKAWSVDSMNDAKQKGELIFMDFTAKWCFTCKVNEKVVIETDGFKELVSKYNIKLLLADWTKRDSVIGDWLKSQGMVGVPAYFIQKPDGSLINLGETITLSAIENAIK